MECSDNLNSFVNTGQPGRSGADVVGGREGGLLRRRSGVRSDGCLAGNMTFKRKSRVFQMCNRSTGL